MWGIKCVLGPHTSTHFPTSSPLPYPHPFPTRQHTSPLTPYTFPHPPHISFLTSFTPQYISLHLPHTPHISSHSSPDLPLHPNTLPYSPHALSHTFLPTSYPTVLIMWRSYQVTRKSPIKFFTATGNLKSCFGVGNVNFRCMKVRRSYHVAKLLWRSYHVAKFLATAQCPPCINTLMPRPIKVTCSLSLWVICWSKARYH